MDFININETEIIQYIRKIKINVLHIELNVKATIQTLCYNIDGLLLTAYVFELSGEDYQNWQNDSWLINYVCNKYNFTISNTESENNILT